MSKLHASIIVTYRCNARCIMCHSWQHPTKPSDEIAPETLEKLPRLFFANITGGEPFLREDLPAIVRIISKKAKRVVISTNGFFTERIVALCKEFPSVGIRISLEGLAEANDAIRGMKDGYAHALATLRELEELGVKDIGFAVTVQDANYADLVTLYAMARNRGYEFATAAVHNSHYFHTNENVIVDKGKIIDQFTRLITLLLSSVRPKDWFRAYFNYGLIRYVRGDKRLIPCEMGVDGFFVDPSGDILPCNGMDKKSSMGNLRTMSWRDIWRGKRAAEVRCTARTCAKECWMIGNAAPAIWRHPVGPVLWVLRNKLRMYAGKEPVVE